MKKSSLILHFVVFIIIAIVSFIIAVMVEPTWVIFLGVIVTLFVGNCCKIVYDIYKTPWI